MEQKKYKLFFISTNEVWGGSEELWYQSVTHLLEQNHLISVAVKYKNPKIEGLRPKVKYLLNLTNRYKKISLIKRVGNKLGGGFHRKDFFQLAVDDFKPDLVIISQGTGIPSVEMMEFCVSTNRKFIIISQITTELSLIWLNMDLQKKLAYLFAKAEKNFFVSRGNIDIHNFLFTYEASNAEVVYNPYSRDKSYVLFPDIQNGFKIAIVGRLECYHKGLDILLHVIAKKKWQDRDVSFNFYGTGPHAYMIERLFSKMHIKNAALLGYANDISSIWSKNHLLLQPSRMEGQSLALLEALNLNRAAIVTNVGGACEIIDDGINGFIAKAATIDDIDEAMERAWNRREEWEEIGEAAGNKFRKVTPEDPVGYLNEKILSVLKSI